jgi:hypothetical protein
MLPGETMHRKEPKRIEFAEGESINLMKGGIVTLILTRMNLLDLLNFSIAALDK